MGANQTVPVPRDFSQKLRAELNARDWGLRTLARAMAARENAQGNGRVESLRRQLKRYVTDANPVLPSAASRESIEDALGMERDSLKADEDDEEAAALLRLPFIDLLTVLVQKAVAEQREGAQA